MKMIGTVEFARMSKQVSMPVMPGIAKPRRTTGGPSAPTLSKASWPVRAPETWNPRSINAARNDRQLDGSSSMIMILAALIEATLNYAVAAAASGGATTPTLGNFHSPIHAGLQPLLRTAIAARPGSPKSLHPTLFSRSTASLRVSTDNTR